MQVGSSAFSINYSSSSKIVGGEGDFHLVSGDNSDVVFAHLAGKMREYEVSVLELDAEHGVR